MLVIDSHLDLAWNALQHNRDLLQSVYTIRTQEGHTGSTGGGGQGTVALPEMRKGRLFLAVVTLMARHTGRPAANIDYGSQAQATAAAQGHLAYYRALEAHGHVRILTDLAALNAHVTEWETWESNGADGNKTPPLGFIISMESADPIWQPQHLEAWHAAGVRLIGPAHYGPGRYAGGTATENGLSEIGVQLLKEMRRVGVILDMTHLCDQSFWQALDVYDGPIIASQLAGNANHAGIGSDLDGGFGRQQSPGDLDTIIELQKVAEILQSRGYSKADITNIMYGNWLRVLRRVWGGK